MKKWKALLCLLFCIPLIGSTLALPISAERGDVTPKLDLLGEATVLAPADRATLHFEVMTSSTVASKAQKENSRLTDAICEAVSDYGTPMREGYYTCEGFSGSRFLVTQRLSLTTDKVRDTEALCRLLIESGASAVCSVSYSCSDLTPYKEEAMRLALANAQQKAAQLGISSTAGAIADVGCFVFQAPNSDPASPVVCVEYSLRLQTP